MNIEQPENLKVLTHLKRERGQVLGRRPDAPAFAVWNSVPDPYSGCGSHPDIVEHLWDRLGNALPADCRGLAYGTPALVQPKSGVILALGMGTQYSLRLPEPLATLAVQKGAKIQTKWSNGDTTDIQKEYGEDWVFGAYLPEELIWCKQVYQMFDYTA